MPAMMPMLRFPNGIKIVAAVTKGVNLLDFNKCDSRTRCDTCLKVTVKKSEQSY